MSASPIAKPLNKDDIIALMVESFNKTPYHQHIGLRFSYNSHEGLRAHFENDAKLMGNEKRKMVHGGVISGVFDALGGVLCSIALIDKYQDLDMKAGLRKLNRLCTIDLNINYHAPAKALSFIAKGEIIHQGSSILHVAMSMEDNNAINIASAHANYMH